MAKYCTSLPSLLRIISVGQYQSKLYHRGKGSHSSVLGGIMTLILTIIFVYYAATTLASVISRKHYSGYDINWIQCCKIVNPVRFRIKFTQPVFLSSNNWGNKFATMLFYIFRILYYRLWDSRNKFIGEIPIFWKSS